MEGHEGRTRELANVKAGETSEDVLKRVVSARQIQRQRFLDNNHPELYTNSELKGDLLEKLIKIETDAQELLINFAAKNNLSARAYHRTLRLARTIADLQSSKKVIKLHVAEAVSYRRAMPKK